MRDRYMQKNRVSSKISVRMHKPIRETRFLSLRGYAIRNHDRFFNKIILFHAVAGVFLFICWRYFFPVIIRNPKPTLNGIL